MLLCLAAAAGTPAWAQLADPTRPPQLAVQPADAAAAAAQAPTGLQSIIYKKDGQGRAAAVINGQVVQLGGRLGDMRLVKVAEDHVILLGPEGRETLRLTPAVEKMPAKVGAGATAKKEASR
jgi:hypothetical protein